MPGSLPHNPPRLGSVARIVLVYFTLSCAWILLSDRALAALVPDAERMVQLQTWKGWFFIAMTSILLWVLLRRAFAAIEDNAARLRRRDAELTKVLGDMATYKFMVDGAGEEIYLVDVDARFTYVNEAAAQSLGYSRDELMALRLYDIDPGFDLARWRAHFAELAAADLPAFETTHRRKDGTLRTKETKPVHMVIGGRAFICGFARDVSERRRLEQELLQSQKMDAIGRLAGGVAHDFNNLLTVIAGYGELVYGSLADDDPRRQDAEQVLRAAERATGLTRQLLAFSRKQVIAPRVLEVDALVQDMGKMLRRLIGENIYLEMQLGADLGRVKADPGQFEQALLNLVVNARDAMPDGGRLIITTEISEFTPGTVRRVGPLRQGPCLRLSVTDTGPGMDEHTLEHLFEPFFTTKARGKGTGLGLSTVYAIIEQCGGAVEVECAPAHGTRVSLCLPLTMEPLQIADTQRRAPSSSIGETVLLVEDDPLVRGLFRQYLTERGYHVLEAGSMAEALAVSASHPGPVDLLVTDVILPGPSGVELARALARERNDMPVLFVSGYTDSASHAEIVRNHAAYLQKPVARTVFLDKVRQLLDARRPAALVAPDVAPAPDF